MIIFKSLFSLLVPILSGVALIHIIWKKRDANSIFLKLFLGTGIGLGVNSLLYFVYLLLFERQSGYFIFQILYLSVLMLFVFFQEKNTPFVLKKLKTPTKLQILFIIITMVIVILTVSIFLIIATRNSYGLWDAWSMYNRTARFIFRGDALWRDAFSSTLKGFHADYPPLVALNVASGWSAIGKETNQIPIAISGAFLFGTVGLLFTSINAHKTLGQATLAIGSLLGVSGFIRMGAAQMADIPLAFFILATGVLLYTYSATEKEGVLVLAGLSAGLAAWTKNEGFVFALISIFLFILVYHKNIMKKLSWFLLGISFPLVIVIFFKLTLAPPNDLFQSLPEQIYQVINLKRHGYILKSFLMSVGTWGNWGLYFIYIVVFGINIKKKTIPAVKLILIILLFQLFTYYSIFIITPHSLSWHLRAYPRILLQVAPLFFFFYFSIVQPPESIFKSIQMKRE